MAYDGETTGLNEGFGLWKSVTTNFDMKQFDMMDYQYDIKTNICLYAPLGKD